MQHALQTTKYSSAVTTESALKTTTSSPFTLPTFFTLIPARLPCPIKLTLTGKKAPASSPPTVNSSEPERSEGVMRGMDQLRACVVEERDHEPAWEETVGYRPRLCGMVRRNGVRGEMGNVREGD
jgi:hypothetical protein